MNAVLRHPVISLMGLALASPITRSVAEHLDHQPSLCPLQRLAGIPCPSCGGTRAVLYFAAGDPVTALKRNAAVVLGSIGYLLYKAWEFHAWAEKGVALE